MPRLLRSLSCFSLLTFVAVTSVGCDSSATSTPDANATPTTVAPAKQESNKTNWKQRQPRSFKKQG
jgi:hypothetical protein